MTRVILAGKPAHVVPEYFSSSDKLRALQRQGEDGNKCVLKCCASLDYSRIFWQRSDISEKCDRNDAPVEDKPSVKPIYIHAWTVIFFHAKSHFLNTGALIARDDDDHSDVGMFSWTKITFFDDFDIF